MNLNSTFDTEPVAVGLINEFSYIVRPINFVGSPTNASTTISSVTSQSASDGMIVYSNGFMISICFPNKTWKSIFNDVSVPFEL